MEQQEHSLRLRRAIAALVRDEDAEPPTDAETAAVLVILAREYELSPDEQATLAKIATGPIGD